jgi:hypothetical protein
VYVMLILKHDGIQAQRQKFDDGGYNVALTTPSQLPRDLGTWLLVITIALATVVPCSDGGAGSWAFSMV